jgi:hypothetical protein
MYLVVVSRLRTVKKKTLGHVMIQNGSAVLLWSMIYTGYIYIIIIISWLYINIYNYIYIISYIIIIISWLYINIYNYILYHILLLLYPDYIWIYIIIYILYHIYIISYILLLLYPDYIYIIIIIYVCDICKVISKEPIRYWRGTCFCWCDYVRLLCNISQLQVVILTHLHHTRPRFSHSAI